MTDMEFFTGFKWAVPRSFKDAVSLCTFQEGDVLYDTPKAYDGDWEDAKKHIDYSLQVKFPKRVTGGALTAGEGVFARNWTSELRLELLRNGKSVQTGQIHTTQGHLYTMLWKGDPEILLDKDTLPPMPLSVTDVHKDLEKILFAELSRSGDKLIFAMARDWSNATSKAKYNQILDKLQGHLDGDPIVLSPDAAGFEDFEDIAPTVDIVLFPTVLKAKKRLTELVKSAVYKPSKGAKKQTFRLRSHGIILN